MVEEMFEGQNKIDIQDASDEESAEILAEMDNLSEDDCVITSSKTIEIEQS